MDYPPSDDFTILSSEDLLERFATASLKRVSSDTKTEEREWEKYWQEIRFEILNRIME